MSDPTTSNILLAVPTRGSDPGTWDVPVNSNSSAIDGFLGGVVQITVSNASFSLTAPAGVVSASSGPFQSQNRILKFTGTLSANVQITLPLPGEYTIQNLTSGNFVLSFIAQGAGKVVATPQGSVMKIWSDGTDAWLLRNTIPGQLQFIGGVSAVPSWITANTQQPYLLADGTVYNISTYPSLGSLYSSTFGGNGGTTFGVPDLRGRVPLSFDGTGTRITVAGCGLNGQTLGASIDSQAVTLTAAQVAAHTHPNTLTDPGHSHPINISPFIGSSAGTNTTIGASGTISTNITTTGIVINNVANTGGQAHPNVQPSLVTGIWLIAT